MKLDLKVPMSVNAASHLLPVTSRAFLGMFAVLGALAGCQSDRRDSPLSVDAGTPAADTARVVAPGDTAAPLPDTAAAVAACNEITSPSAPSGGVISFQTEFTLAAKPIRFGEPNKAADGSTMMPVNLRFFLSEVSLRTADGRKVPADLLNAAGASAPFGVILANAEDADSLKFRVRAAPGAYTGVSFVLGLTDACNHLNGADRKNPLTDSSQMTWPPPFGYLFLRTEIAMIGPSGQTTGNRSIHMGGLPGRMFAPELTVPVSLSVANSATPSLRLRLSLDEVLKGADMPADLGEFIGPPGLEDVEAGERLRLNATKVALFSIVAGP